MIIKCSWDVRYSCYFEPTWFNKGILHLLADARPPFAAEGRSLHAVTHLA